MREARAVVLGQGLSRRAGPAAAPPKPSLKLPDHAREKKFNACAPPDSWPPPASSVFACSAHDHEPPVCPVAVHMHTTPRIIGPSMAWLSVIAHSCSGLFGHSAFSPPSREPMRRARQPAGPLDGPHPSPQTTCPPACPHPRRVLIPGLGVSGACQQQECRGDGGICTISSKSRSPTSQMGARRRGGFGNQSSQSDLEDTKGQISISSPQGPIGLD